MSYTMSCWVQAQDLQQLLLGPFEKAAARGNLTHNPSLPRQKLPQKLTQP